jgi:hypothetical protein
LPWVVWQKLSRQQRNQGKCYCWMALAVVTSIFIAEKLYLKRRICTACIFAMAEQ